MTKVSRKVLLACLTIAVCISLLAAGTYALFSARFGVTNHLAAGNLSAKLVRDNLETVSLSENGYLTRAQDDTDIDFSKETSENLFGIDEGTTIAPGCGFTADMILTNNGTVAFKYWIEIKIAASESEIPKLAEQLKVTVTVGESVTTKTLDQGLTVDANGSGLGVVVVGESARFSVSVEFCDLENNNETQNQSINFDLTVHAVQDATVR